MGNTTSAAPLGSAAAPGGEKHIRLELDIQKEKMGKLIGTQGKTIQAVQLRAQNITLRTPSKEEALADDGTKFVSVVLSGRAADVFKTAEMINGIVNVCLAVLTVTVLPKDVPPLLHPSIRNLQKELEVDTLKLPRKNDKPPRVVAEGYLELVQAAYQRILVEVERIAREQTDARESKKLKEISASRMEGGKEDVDGDVDEEGEDKAPGEKIKADAKDGGAGGKKDKAGKQHGAKDSGPTVTERLSLPDAGVSIMKKGRMHSIEKETRAKLSLEGNVVIIEGGGSCVNKAKRDVERMLRKLEAAKDSAGKEGQEGGNEKSKGDGETAVLSEAAVASIGGEGGDPKGGSEGAVSACDA